MRKLLPIIVLLILSQSMYAQSWDVNIAGGFCSTRLIPVSASTKQTKVIRYRFMGAGEYVSPEVYIHINEHSSFSFSYEASQSQTGIAFRSTQGSDVERNYEFFTMHNFCVGYYSYRLILKERAVVGWYGKLGLAYGYNTGGGGGSSGTNATTGVYVQAQQMSNAEIMPDFWMPTGTLGVSIGPNKPDVRGIADRLALNLGLTIGFRDIYADYAKVGYSILDNGVVQTGVAQYRGLPLTMHVGVNYRLWRIEHTN